MILFFLFTPPTDIQFRNRASTIAPLPAPAMINIKLNDCWTSGLIRLNPSMSPRFSFFFSIIPRNLSVKSPWLVKCYFMVIVQVNRRTERFRSTCNSPEFTVILRSRRILGSTIPYAKRKIFIVDNRIVTPHRIIFDNLPLNIRTFIFTRYRRNGATEGKEDLPSCFGYSFNIEGHI